MNIDKNSKREEQLDALHDRLTMAVEGLVTSTDWRKALEFAARFRSRSFRNAALIATQMAAAYDLGLVPKPYPTYVAGFRQWQSLGRSVRKGMHGLQIFAPVTGRFASETPADPDSWRRLARGERARAGETARTKVIGVKVAYVFDISMTEGPAVPSLPQPTPIKGQAPKGLWDGLADQITARGFALRLVSSSASLGGADGLTDYQQRQISIRTDMDELNQTAALAHEIAHATLHGPNNPNAAADAQAHRGIREVEAESVSLFVHAAHGLDVSGFSVPYVSAWANSVPGRSPVEVVQATAERVRTTAVTILNNLQTDQIGTGDPPGLDRATPPPSPSTTLARSVEHVRPSKAVGL